MENTPFMQLDPALAEETGSAEFSTEELAELASWDNEEVAA